MNKVLIVSVVIETKDKKWHEIIKEAESFAGKIPANAWDVVEAGYPVVVTNKAGHKFTIAQGG